MRYIFTQIRAILCMALCISIPIVSEPKARRIFSVRRSALYLLTFLALGLTPPAYSAEILILIDDMGNKSEDSSAFGLPTEVAFAILPHTPYSTQFAHTAGTEQRDVILHMPMEALSGLYMGPGGISSTMNKNTITDRLKAAHNTVPGAIGLNNHMGSKLTQLTMPMQATMEYLDQRGMFFLDSRTTRFSKAEKIARSYGLPAARRHVFLDHVRETGHIDFQFRRLLHRAKKHGFAIGIGHPHQVTIDYLKVALQTLSEHNIRLTTLSDRFIPAEPQWAWNEPGQLSR